LETQATMDTYIRESPKTLSRVLNEGSQLVDQLVKLFAEEDYKKIKIVASGSSYNASYCSKKFLENVLDIPVEVVTPFTFVHYSQCDKNSFHLVISQSGSSTNSIEALDHIRKTDSKAIGITGNLDSELKKHCDYIIDYGVGVEKVGYVTKGVVSLVLFLDLFALYAAKKLRKLEENPLEEKLREIRSLINNYSEVYEKTQRFIATNFSLLTSMHQVNLLGNGSTYAVALEGALKIGETVCIPSFPYESEEFLHGPNLQLTPTYSNFIIDANDDTTPRLKEIFEAISSVSERSFYIGIGKEDQNPKKLMIDCQVEHDMLPLVYLQVFQLIAFQVTDALKRWGKHPVFEQNFKKKIQYKVR